MPQIYEISPVSSFKRRYWLALTITALLFFFGYALLSITFSEQSNYISLMRLIEKQTTNCQDIDKNILLLQTCDKEKVCIKQSNAIKSTLYDISQTHQTLLKRHKQLYIPKQNARLDSLLLRYTNGYAPIIGTAETIIRLKYDFFKQRGIEKVAQQIKRKIVLNTQKILYEEGELRYILSQMSKEYNHDTAMYIQNIQFYQTIILLFGLFVLFLEAVWLFAPITKKLKRYVQQVQETQEASTRKNEELTLAYQHLQTAEEVTRQNAEEVQKSHAELLNAQWQITKVNAELIEKNKEIQATNDLRHINQELEESRFFDKSLSHFAEVMRWQANQTIYSWSEHLLSVLVPYFDGLQGVLYAFEEEKNSLYIAGSYATDHEVIRQKNEVGMGENLVGQVAKSLKPIYFHTLNNHAHNFSVGTATEEIEPEALIIQPLIFNDTLAGVLEMTALQAWDERYLELLKRMSESIGTNLSALQDQMQINQLFADSQISEKKLKRSVIKIRENEERFRKLSELTQEGLLFVNDGVIKDLNDVAVQMMGYDTEKELWNTHYINLIAPINRFEIEHNHLLKDGLLHETIAQRKNGETFHMEIQSREVKYGQETITVISLRDITIRKSTERELEEANRVAKLSAEVEKQHKHILSSIEYAKRIQHSILPKGKILTKGFVENFVIYTPKDIVSGDFYWFAEKNEHALMAAVDCTGHGVPGAFMSIIGYSNLNKIVVEQGYTEPDAILRKLDRDITAILKQQDAQSESRDGMDVALCSLNVFEGTLSYAGAQRPLYLVRNGELQEFKGNPFPIGGNFKFKKQKEFTKHEINLEKGDTIYIFSDGYPDQFGGLENRKYMSKRFKELLVRVQPYSLDEQKDILQKEFEVWKGSHKQMDDVMVIGFRF